MRPAQLQARQGAIDVNRAFACHGGLVPFSRLISMVSGADKRGVRGVALLFSRPLNQPNLDQRGEKNLTESK